MAQIRFSNLVNDIRGASGGNTFSRARSGAIVSAKRSPRGSKANKPGQRSVQFSGVARMWRTISEENRREWNSLAIGVTEFNRLGFQRQPSGFELFCFATYYREVANLEFLPSPIVNPNPLALYSSNARYSILFNRYFHDVPTFPFYSAWTITYVTRAYPPGQQVPKSAAYKFSRLTVAPRFFQSDWSAGDIPMASPLVPITEFGHFNMKFVTIEIGFNWPIHINYEQALIIPV